MATPSSYFGGVAKWMAAAVYILSGLALLVLGLPLAALPFNWEGLARWLPWALMALPVWLGIASAPGCLTAVILVIGGRRGNPTWVRLSLWGGLIGATAGLAGGSLMALFVPFSLVGMIGSVVLLYAVDDVHGRSGPFLRRWWGKILGTAAAVFAITLWALQAKPQG